MQLSKIGAILKTNKMIEYLDDGEDQWIGDGTAYYCVRGMPQLEKDQIYTLFDIPQEKRGDYIFTIIRDLWKYNIENTASEEIPVKPYALRLGWFGSELAPVNTPNGLLMLETQYLKPFKDEKSGYELYMRSSENGDCFAVKSGMFILGIIKPYPVVDPVLREQIRTVSGLLPPVMPPQPPENVSML
ncbi:MAG: hypothetical protein IJ766_03815 [Clostridia bacterium]|nr:hypothetical protein [Clostridia bacterium]